MAKSHSVTGTVTAVTNCGNPDGNLPNSESVPSAINAIPPPGARVLRHRECGSHPAAEAEISKMGWGGPRANSGGRRPGAGRKSKTLVEARIAASLARVTQDPGLGDRWYCAQTHWSSGLVALDGLVRQGFAAFLPRIERELPDRTRVLSAMFPGYLFVRFDRDQDHWRPIASTTGIRRLFGVSPELPVPVPPGVVEALIGRATRDSAVRFEPHPSLLPILPGTPIRVAEGPFADFEGICRMSGGGRVKVLIEIMGREVAFHLPRRAVEAIEPAVTA